MSGAPLFAQIDTFILRVADHAAAAAWYAEALGLQAAYTDAAEGLTVLALAQGTSLTLWQRKAGEAAAGADATGAFPVFATADAAAARDTLMARGVHAGDLLEGPGVRYFQFQDADGNRLEACQVLDG